MSSQHLPPINLASLTAEQREKFQICRETLSYHTNDDVLSYLNSGGESATITNMLSMFVCSDYNVNKTLKLAETFRKDKYKIAFSKPTILDAAPFCKAPDGREEPDSYQCLLENESGPARDVHGRPITLVKGMFYGSFVETTRMVNYMRSRAATHYHKETVRSVLVIFDLTFSPTGGAETTFRFPDSAYREVIKYQESYMMEFMNQSSSVAVVGVPKAMARIMDVTRKAWGYGCAWSFHNDYASLIRSGIVTAENLPVRCGGSFDFNLNEYVSWRAREEGLEREVCKVAPRRYTKPGRGKSGRGKIAIRGTDFICDFPETYDMVMSADNKASVLMESVFVGHFKVNDRPCICVMLPWNEFRIHKVGTSNMFGKCEKVVWLSQATKIDTFTDFVWEVSGAASSATAGLPGMDERTSTAVNNGNGSDSKNSNNNTSGNSTDLSARYTITLQNEGDEPITIEQSDSDNNQQAMRELVDRIDQSLSLDAVTLKDTCLEHLKGTQTLEVSMFPPNVLESKEHRRGEEREKLGGADANGESSSNQRGILASSSSTSSSSQPKTQKKGKKKKNKKNNNNNNNNSSSGEGLCSSYSDGVRSSDMLSSPHATVASSPHDGDGTSWGNVLTFLNLK